MAPDSIEAPRQSNCGVLILNNAAGDGMQVCQGPEMEHEQLLSGPEEAVIHLHPSLGTNSSQLAPFDFSITRLTRSDLAMTWAPPSRDQGPNQLTTEGKTKTVR